MKRMFETDILSQDWYLNMSVEYRNFYLYVYFKAEATGFWLPKTKHFKEDYMKEKRMFPLEAFLNKVNRDDKGKFLNRIEVQDNSTWFIEDVFINTFGKTFKLSVAAHLGALRALIKNKVSIETIRRLGWISEGEYILLSKTKVSETDDNQQLSIEPLPNPLVTPSKPVTNPREYSIPSFLPSLKEKEKEKEKESRTAHSPPKVAAAAGAGEGKYVDIGKLREMVFADKQYVKKLKLSEQLVATWLGKFNEFLRFTGVRQKTEADYRLHFASWLEKYADTDPADYSLLPLRKAKKVAEEFVKGKVKHRRVVKSKEALSKKGQFNHSRYSELK
jgi:hypothetical protein